MDARARWAIGLSALLAACGEGVGTGGQRLPPATSRSIDFGAVVERTTRRLEVTVTNPLAEPLEVLPLAGGAPFGGELFAPVTVASGESLSIPLVFRPEEAGAASGRLALRTPFGTLATFAVAGLGVEDRGLRCDEELEFGPEPIDGAEVRRSFRCDNLSAGQTRVRVGAVGGDERDAFRVEPADADAPYPLPAGGTLEVSVVFRPRPYGGTSFAWVELFREDEARRGRVLLRGTTAARCLRAVPEELGFPCLPPGESTTQRLTVLNTCEVEAAVAALLVEGDAAFAVAEAVPFRVPAPVNGIPGERTVEVTFSPGPDGGPELRAMLVFTPDEASQPRLEVPLAGCVDPP